jgi:uncharacterized protein (TIGR02145 family)
MWLRTGTEGAATLTTNGAATYKISSGDYATAGTYYINRYAKDATCNTAWVPATGTYTFKVLPQSVNQPQGGCTFTQPPMVGTFANFDKNYSASTFVTLMDERDGNNYTVVKVGARWFMAQNLNYQNGLTWQARPDQPSTYSGQNTALIGHFWCPGAYSSTYTPTKESCKLWGALYSWETAMSFDGKGNWVENKTYISAGNVSSPGSKFNHGRNSNGAGTGGRGICPLNWHVPTYFEWAVFLDVMEGGGTSHQAGNGNGWARGNAGARGKAKCVVPDKSTEGDTYVNDNTANWYYHQTAPGLDLYGFRVLPAGWRIGFGEFICCLGNMGIFWTSSADDAGSARNIQYGWNQAKIGRFSSTRSHAFSVRCVRD